MVEVAAKYAVDGIHFDYIRYPDENTCFCDGCRERFEKKIGHKVDGLARSNPQERRTYSSSGPSSAATTSPRSFRLLAPRPARFGRDIKISAAVFPNWPIDRQHIGQDWKLWCAAGLAGFRVPDGLHSPRHGIRESGKESA